MKELLKQFIIFGIGATIGKFLSLLLLPVYSSIFSPEEYGYIDLIITITTIVSIFGMLQIETGYQRYFFDAKKEMNEKELFSTGFYFVLLCSSILTILLLFCLNIIFEELLKGLFKKELLIAILTILPTNLLSFVYIIFRYLKCNKLFLLLSLLQTIGSVILTIYVVIVLKGGLMGIFISNLLITCLVLFISLFFIRKYLLRCVDILWLKKMLAYALPQFPARIGSVANTYVNRFFMMAYLSMSAIGLYSVGLKIASMMQLFLFAFQLAWNPYCFEMLDSKNHREHFSFIYVKCLVLVSIIVFLFAILSKDIVLLFTNRQYVDSYHLVPALILYNSLYLLKEIVEVGIKVTKKTKYTSYVFFVSTALNILLLFVLIPLLGLNGVVISLLVSNLFLFIGTMYVSNRLYPIPYNYLLTTILLIVDFIVIILVLYMDFSFCVKILLGIAVVISSYLYFKNDMKQLISYFSIKCLAKK
ncbi:lipopolysaccharide biosynthesis protein [Bacteroides bouchesdurhonensis]